MQSRETFASRETRLWCCIMVEHSVCSRSCSSTNRICISSPINFAKYQHICSYTYMCSCRNFEADIFDLNYYNVWYAVLIFVYFTNNLQYDCFNKLSGFEAPIKVQTDYFLKFFKFFFTFVLNYLFLFVEYVPDMQNVFAFICWIYFWYAECIGLWMYRTEFLLKRKSNFTIH